MNDMKLRKELLAVLVNLDGIAVRETILASEAEIPQPCDVHQVNDCVSVKECNRRMKAIEERMDKMEQRFNTGVDNILKKLDAMDQRSEDRAIALNRRIDPMMERLAETSGQVKMMKEQIRDARAVATIGGEK